MEELPESLRNSFQNVDALFNFFKHESNFLVDLEKGNIVLHIKKIKD